jgi:hypothetical protein
MQTKYFLSIETLYLSFHLQTQQEKVQVIKKLKVAHKKITKQKE